MTSGRRPKPTRVKELAGNPGRRPLNEREPQPPSSSGRAPRGLGLEGSRFWRRYGPVLAELGVLTQVDEPALRMAAEHWEVAVRAATELRDEGLTIEGRDGPKKNPLTQVLRDNSQALRGYLVEFGMTPASRAKVRLPEAEQPSLAEILFAGVAAEAGTRQGDEDPFAGLVADDDDETSGR